MRLKSKTIDIKVSLLKKGLSISKFSQCLKINASYANQIVNGKKNPSPNLAKNIAELLEVDIEDLFTFENDDIKRKINN
ncbi:TPA: helix-turn-helix transcriptional regulator [Staphylococcus aureus]|nr:helix-turn-helix transcriptional regulator [Staphylococcus aureus]EKF1480683.1 helix-turn-helix transcriptional regulator [Staphylococcus aureus]ELK6794077.1 helix-turn-helix transcriptional regulator [Staphylococcus aureus]MBU4950447.1 helix-turn-helix transcriptional regulator [Staphylococcus aureus]MBU4954325.1 helix-turn-helix transcriptional regulator [Staphylococcus aureus]MCQ1414958.1 helix-turn-helix domain-containing protein [Staphylococcus aureus]